jgi:two-component system, sensor histidine kinase
VRILQEGKVGFNLRISLRGQILVYTLSAILLAVGTLSLFTLNRESGREKESSRLEALETTETFASIVLNDTYLLDKAKLQILLNAYMANKQVISARVYDANSQMIAKGIRAQGDQSVEVRPIQSRALNSFKDPEAYFNEKQIEVVHPLKTTKGDILGYLFVSFSQDELQEHLNLQFYDIIIALLMCLLFAIFATIIFSSWITQPLRELMDKANRIIQGETVPLTLDRQDEIGSLALSLNTMLRSINTRDEKMRQLAASLELKVIQRTEELASALNKAEAATDAKASFLASMTHELRTPMNGVIGTASLMADSDLTHQQREQLDIIRNCGNHLLTVINDILDFSKIEAAKMELEYAPLDLKKLIASSIDIVKPMVQSKNLIIESDIDEDVPDYIEGDAVRLRQILVNLESNAIKFTNRGGIYISVKVKETKTHKKFLEFAIRDTGIGIEAEVQKKLFNAFTQADSSTTRKYGGTGLGLVISKKLIELMGGKIAVHSKPGKGSTFTFTIAAKATEAIPAVTASEALSDHTLLGIAKPMRILLAEDNLVNQMVAKGFLEKLGYSPDIANNGVEVISAIKDKGYDLIFMDMMMPEMDGIEATRIICANTPVQQRPWIIAMTANALEEHKQQCLNAGMNDFLTKPFTLASLEAVLLAAPSALGKGHAEHHAEPDVVQKSRDTKENTLPLAYQSINKQKIFDSFKDDEDLVPFAIEAFIKDYPHRLNDMEQSIKNDNAEQLAMAAHTLKGAVSNFYAASAVEQAAAMEKNAKEHNLVEANQNFENLKSELAKVHQDLTALLAEIS